jgi:hypothetical protein
LRSYRRGKKQFLLQNVRKAAAETGFYEVAELNGSVTNRVELAFSKFESEIAPLIESASQGNIPSGVERVRLASYIALQTARTRLTRDRYTATINATLDFMMEQGFFSAKTVMSQYESAGKTMSVGEAESISEGLKTGSIFAEQHPNDHIRLIARMITELTPNLVDRAWMILKSPRRDFITSDNPVVFTNPPELQNRLMGVGPLTAAEIYIPLDPKTTLFLCQKDVFEELTIEDRVHTALDENVIYVNHLIAESSYKWIFQNPEGKNIKWLLPDERLELGQVNGKPFDLKFNARRRARDL